MPTWSAPVRFGEVDQQGVVFNSHYLLYCDEAMGAYCEQHGVLGFAERIQLVSSNLTWTGSARWGDIVDVEAAPTRVGTSSLAMRFAVTVGGTPICTVETVYVNVGPDGRPAPIPAEVREKL
jgi:acyl-CoA thioester hydrolase